VVTFGKLGRIRRLGDWPSAVFYGRRPDHVVRHVASHSPLPRREWRDGPRDRPRPRWISARPWWRSRRSIGLYVAGEAGGGPRRRRAAGPRTTWCRNAGATL